MNLKNFVLILNANLVGFLIYAITARLFYMWFKFCASIFWICYYKVCLSVMAPFYIKAEIFYQRLDMKELRSDDFLELLVLSNLRWCFMHEKNVFKKRRF